MATPHVTATVALMWSAAETLRGQVADTRELLDGTAVATDDLSCDGTPTDNNVWGHGRLDAFEAVNQAPRGPTGSLTGAVRSGSEPMAGAEIRADGPSPRETRTNEEGEYQLPRLSVGQYEVTVSQFGYLPRTAQVTITENETSTRDFNLAVAPRRTVSGHVRDAADTVVSGAAISFPGTPLPIVRSDATGAYQVPDVPEGSFDMLADNRGCLLPDRQHVTVAGDTTVDFTLPIKSDDYGHVCATTTRSWVDADTATGLSGDDASASVPLPFPVNLYGKSYRSAYVSTNGSLSFTTQAPISWNGPVPSTDEPNTAIYAFWDDLFVDAPGSVRTDVIGTAPRRQFVVEWRDVRFAGGPSDVRFSFEIVLTEAGRITVQYKGIDEDQPAEQGASATVGI